MKSPLKRDKKEHFDSIREEMEKAHRINRTKYLFQCMNRLMKQACLTVKLLQSESGRLLREDPNIMMQWQENCERLYSSSKGIEKMRMGGNKEPTPQ